MPDTIALLRGVNVGGHRKIAMADLRAIASDCGHRGVQSYIQSGNLVFDRGQDDLAALARELEAAIQARAGVSTTVVLRTRRDWEAVALRHPQLGAGAELNQLHVVFLERAPDPERAASFEGGVFAPDVATLLDREVYLHTPGGMARTKLTPPWFERQLGVQGTARNWRTVGKLLELARG